MRSSVTSKLLALTIALAVMPLVGCGDDDEPTNGGGNGTATIVGSWTATSMTAPSQPAWGDAVSDDGMVIIITFESDGDYSFSAANDFPADPWICDGTASCSWTGTYSVSGDNLLFDEGTADEANATYSVTSTTLIFTFEATAAITDPYRYVMQRN